MAGPRAGKYNVPGNMVPGCPNFPECGCRETCIDQVPPQRIMGAEWLLIICLFLAILIAAFQLWLTGGFNG